MECLRFSQVGAVFPSGCLEAADVEAQRSDAPGIAACTTVNVRPAIVSVPVRGRPVTLNVKRYSTLPLPVPVDLDEIVSHEALLVAVHAQVLVVTTLTVAAPSLAGTCSIECESEYVHAGGGGGGGDGGGGAGPGADACVMSDR